MNLSIIKSRKKQAILISVGAVAAATTAALAPVQVSASPTQHVAFAPHSVVWSGFDNPRQLSVTPDGDLLVASAGRGGPNCYHGMCIGATGSVERIWTGSAHPQSRVMMRGLLSGAGKDGSFAVGSDGASKQLRGPYYSIITYAPPDVIPGGLPGYQAGKLMAKAGKGKLHVVANISKYEVKHDPDGEGVDSNPYSVLALQKKILVADAAGDDILAVRGGKVSLWVLMPEYGKKIDAVPTVVTKGNDGFIYIGELHSEIPGAAKVWKLDRQGNLLRSWGHFTTVTGVARAADGTLYVSELEGGNCSFKQIPKCFPGRVVRISPNGDRSYRKVPFPAGIVVTHGRVYVAAFSISPGTGFGGNPAWSGQIWRIFDQS